MVKNSIAGIKKIKLDFEFTYSKNGDDDIGDTIIVKAPSFEEMDVHAKMTSYVTNALFVAMPKLTGISGLAENTPSENELTDEQDLDRNSLSMMALGMTVGEYCDFLNFVKKTLTNNAKFAHIDGEEIPITDMLWRNIGENGGQAAIDRILGSFVSFFIDAINETKAA